MAKGVLPFLLGDAIKIVSAAALLPATWKLVGLAASELRRPSRPRSSRPAAGGHAVVVPKEIAATFSSKRPPVIAQVDGVEYRSRLMVYGGICYLGLRKDLLRRIAARPGRPGRDRTGRGPRAARRRRPHRPSSPPELLEALAGNPAADAAYQALPPSHRREYARWIGEAARPETRAERVAKTVRRLSGS